MTKSSSKSPRSQQVLSGRLPSGICHERLRRGARRLYIADESVTSSTQRLIVLEQVLLIGSPTQLRWWVCFALSRLERPSMRYHLPLNTQSSACLVVHVVCAVATIDARAFAGTVEVSADPSNCCSMPFVEPLLCKAYQGTQYNALNGNLCLLSRIGIRPGGSV